MLRAALALALVLGALPAAARPAASDDSAVPSQVRRRLGPPTPLAKLGDSLGRSGLELARLLRASFGVDARAVPIYVVDRPTLVALERSISQRDRIHPRLRGFAYRGVVYLDGGHLEIRETLVHELLHALSPRFTREAHARGHAVFVEGVTQYLTRATGITTELRRRGLRRRGTAYGAYLRFAERIADLVGDNRLADCYFRAGFHRLERDVDRLAGPGRFARALRHLDRDDLGAALRALGAAATHPFDGVFLHD